MVPVCGTSLRVSGLLKSIEFLPAPCLSAHGMVLARGTCLWSCVSGSGGSVRWGAPDFPVKDKSAESCCPPVTVGGRLRGLARE